MREELFGPIVTTYVYPEGKWEETLGLVDRGSPYGAHRRRLRGRPRRRDPGGGGAPLRGRQLLRQRQADRRGRRPAAVRRRARLGHERQGRVDVEPDPLGQPADDQGDLRARRATTATRSWACRPARRGRQRLRPAGSPVTSLGRGLNVAPHGAILALDSSRGLLIDSPLGGRLPLDPAMALAASLPALARHLRAWRNVIADAYPDEKVRWRSIWGAYLAGVGVNATDPGARGRRRPPLPGKHRVNNSTYTTLASSLAVMAIFDITAALALFAYALTQNVLRASTSSPTCRASTSAGCSSGRACSPAVARALGIASASALWAARHVARLQAAPGPGFHRAARGRAATCAGSRCGRRSTGRPRIAETLFFLKAFHIDATRAQRADRPDGAERLDGAADHAGRNRHRAGAARRGARRRRIEDRLVAFSVGVKLTVTARTSSSASWRC